jgi:hypothetical protein
MNLHNSERPQSDEKEVKATTQTQNHGKHKMFYDVQDLDVKINLVGLSFRNKLLYFIYLFVIFFD